MPEYVRLNEALRLLVRSHPTVGASAGVWWCPFCDNSQGDGRLDCAKCGAVVVTPSPRAGGIQAAKIPAAGVEPVGQAPVSPLPLAKEPAGDVVRKEAGEDMASAPSPDAPVPAAEEVVPAPGRTPAAPARRTPRPRIAKGRKR